MAEESAVRRSRTVVVPSPGAKLMVVIGVLFLVWAGYLAFSPIERANKDGRLVSCGTAMGQAPRLTRLTCGQVNSIRQWQAGTVALAGIIVIAGGFVVFGGSRRVEVERRTHASAPEGAAEPPAAGPTD
jgi:hypothetical protein